LKNAKKLEMEMMRAKAERDNWKDLADFRGRFMERFLEFLKQKFGIPWYEKINHEYMEWHREKYGGENANS
jgi:hypothetical protein